MELIRIYLGLGLFAKGIFFTMNIEEILSLVEQGKVDFAGQLIARYIGLAHLAGGVMLTIGILTRAAALAQLPILMGAVFLVHLREGLFTKSPNLELAILTLFLLVLITAYGGGRWSADYRIARSTGD